MMAGIPIFLLTGFLGSGKTTWLNAALRSPEFESTLVIVNEFGDIGIDQDLIAVSNDSVTLLENGCLCCAVKGDLLATLDRSWQRRQAESGRLFSRVVIETSGLVEPSPIISALTAEERLFGRYRLAGVITVVDAINGLGTMGEHEECLHQVAVADRILVTKTDLALAEGVQADLLISRLREVNPTAEILVATPAFQSAAMFDPVAHGQQVYAIPDPAVVENHQRTRAKISTVSIVRDVPLSINTVELLLDAIKANAGSRLLRLKGFVDIAESPGRPAVVHGAQRLIHPLFWLQEWPTDDRRTRIVLITCDWSKEEIVDLFEYIEALSMRTTVAKRRASGQAV